MQARQFLTHLRKDEGIQAMRAEDSLEDIQISRLQGYELRHGRRRVRVKHSRLEIRERIEEIQHALWPKGVLFRSRFGKFSKSLERGIRTEAPQVRLQIVRDRLQSPSVEIRCGRRGLTQIRKAAPGKRIFDQNGAGFCQLCLSLFIECRCFRAKRLIAPTCAVQSDPLAF